MIASAQTTGAARIPSLPELLRAAYPRAAAKLAARAAHRSPRTTEDWLAGRSTPDAEQLLAMIAECPRLRAAVREAVEGFERQQGPCP